MPPFRIVPKSIFDTLTSSPGPTINGLTPGVEYVIVDEASVSGVFVPLAPPVAPTITTAASVSETDNGTSVTYVFTPPVFNGTPTPTLTRVLTLDGVDVTGAMIGNVYVAAETSVTQALVMTYTVSNGVAPNATNTISRTVPALVVTPTLCDFELLNEAGSTSITSVPNLRVSIDNGTSFFALSAVPGHPGLTIARGADGKSLVISGWAGGIVPAGLRVHYEQAIPGEPNSAPQNTATNFPALFARRVGAPAPVNPTPPGMTITATRHNAPVGVS